MLTTPQKDEIALSVVDLIAETLKPEDVFSDDILEEWAMENGWEKKD